LIATRKTLISWWGEFGSRGAPLLCNETSSRQGVVENPTGKLRQGSRALSRRADWLWRRSRRLSSDGCSLSAHLLAGLLVLRAVLKEVRSPRYP